MAASSVADYGERRQIWASSVDGLRSPKDLAGSCGPGAVYTPEKGFVFAFSKRQTGVLFASKEGTLE